MATDRFGFTQVAEGMAQKATAVASHLLNLIKMFAFDQVAISVTSSNVTLTSTQEKTGGYVRATGASTGARQVIVSTTVRLWIFNNATTGGFSHTFKTSAGLGVSVAPGTHKLLYCDGTNVVSIT